MTRTPGPWKVEHYCGHPHLEVWGENGKQRIAYLQDHLAENEANARLIAEAPNLLAALIRLREWVRNPGEDDSAENEAVIYQAEAAIARAEGETP